MRKLGEAIGSFLDVDCDHDELCLGDSMRIKVLIDISKNPSRGY